MSADISPGLKWLRDELEAEDKRDSAAKVAIAPHPVRPKLKKQLPYVPWFHGDFLRSTVGWTLMEQAVYWKLLCAQWEIGPLPVATNRLASIAGLDVDEFLQVWQEVQKKFNRLDAGTINERLVNERMEAHRESYLKYRAGQSDRGKKGMAARWGKRASKAKAAGSNE